MKPIGIGIFLLSTAFQTYAQNILPLLGITVQGKYYRIQESDSSAGPLSIASSDTAGIRTWFFNNHSKDTISLSNVVPYGTEGNHVYITGLGNHPLSRTYLFIPGRMPVNVIVPDNAWELGFAALTHHGKQLASLTRRVRESITNGQRRRFETILYPGGSVSYRQWSLPFSGPWQEGLRSIFQEKKLFDTDTFNLALFQRKDLQWIRHSYVMHLIQGWDHRLYNPNTNRYVLDSFILKGKKLYGGDDVIGIWPTWPSLGLDQRNQFDLYRDMPGGLMGLKRLGEQMRQRETKLFIAYNPWDESTRLEGHLIGLEKLIKETGADGVVLDTRGASSLELQEAADKARPGVVMYSEGMAVPKDMPNIVSGRVHNALYHPPLLNLNKFIHPAFAIFRVAELFKEPISREFSTSLFNGYGTELNIFAPGMPEWVTEQYRYLGNTSRILRENTSCFTAGELTPLMPTLHDSIWVNQWSTPTKTIHTIYANIPQGFKGPLFNVGIENDKHYVSLWHHHEISPQQQNQNLLLEAQTDAFHHQYLGTNNEGAVDVIASLPILLRTTVNNHTLHVSAKQGMSIRIWMGHPAYDKQPIILQTGSHQLDLFRHFGVFEGKLVIQLFDKEELLDERIVFLKPGQARSMSKVPTPSPSTPTVKANKANEPDYSHSSSGMKRIPAGKFVFTERHGDDFIPYPKDRVGDTIVMSEYQMDEFPVTNGDYYTFIQKTGYKPSDTTNFLKHWTHGKPADSLLRKPVVHVSLEDARAYAKWAGKRLPTELEWQYAAQTTDGREWPWIQEKPVTRELEHITETLTTINLKGIGDGYCNLGNGLLDPVGSYPKGMNPYGLQDLTGSVWQLTADEYINGSYRFILLKGGSHFKPSGSWWYVQGGPRELNYRQQLLRISPGFERNGTVGFRCVK